MLIAVLAAFSLPLSAKKQKQPSSVNIVFPVKSADVSRSYGKLDYGIRLQVKSDVSTQSIVDLSELPSKEASMLPRINFDYTMKECVEQYLDNFATDLGLKVNSDMATDYILSVTVKECRLRIKSYNPKKKTFSSSGAMVISWQLLSPDREVVISSTSCMGRSTANTESELFKPITRSYSQALRGIDWDKIATKLKASKTAREAANSQVKGDGNTPLEHTVIRWYIISSPQGADVSWRVVSSTPEVANTNANFVGTTPYESTESFDIRGLTFNNAGNVQIEVTCERQGYLPQKRRFNLRQAIEQKEISAKFNLVKETEEE